jgi:hypothetical protein
MMLLALTTLWQSLVVSKLAGGLPTATEDAALSQTTRLDGTTHNGSTMTGSLSEEGAQALALIASEWFKAARRLIRITQETSPDRVERERAQLAYSSSRINGVLSQNGLRMVTHEGTAFTPQLPVEPVNPEDFESEEGLVVYETLEPTVLLDGRVIARGRVVLARSE